MTRTSSPPLTVKACVFDAYGTLLDVAAAARRCERALAEVPPLLGPGLSTR